MNWLEKARVLAMSHEYEEWLSYRHCAVIVSGGKLLSIGYNNLKRNSLVMRFKHHDLCKLHAELAAIIQVRRKIDLRGSKLYVVRVSKDGKMQNSAPCEMCRKVIRIYGISRVIYSIDENEFGVWNTKEELT